MSGRPFFRFQLICSVACLLFLVAIRPVGAVQAESSETLAGKYRQLEDKIARSPLGIPAYLDSYAEKNISGVDIYGVVAYPFDVLQKELESPPAWCSIIVLHPNIRACTYRLMDSSGMMTLFNVNKPDDTFRDATPIEFSWNIGKQPGYFDIMLNADEGPFYTKDHRFSIEAIPLDNQRSFVHLRYTYRYGTLANLAIKSFLALFVKERTGFSIVGRDSHGRPVYATGLQGVNERNVIRYYLAILAYLDAHKMPADQRFEKSLNSWHDRAARYKNLTTAEKKAYISTKKKDLQNQVMLQETLKKPL